MMNKEQRWGQQRRDGKQPDFLRLGLGSSPNAWRREDGGAKTVGDVLSLNREQGPGFDMARLVLAFAVLGSHSIITSYGRSYQDVILLGPYKSLILCILPMFFALSGFLISGSLSRVKSLKTFLMHRILRIVPALTCEVFMSALILGPIVTTFTLPAYFSDFHFYDYFFNIIGRVRYILPGVFVDNPLANIVNASLWTVPIEIQCYILFSILIVLGLATRKIAVLAIFCIAILIQAVGEFHGFLAPDPTDIVRHFTLFCSFIGGAAAYLWRDRIKLTYLGIGVATLVMAISFWSGRYYFLAPVCSVYLVICFGMVKFPKIPILSDGDYSYGIYLYGFPVQQTLMYYFPDNRNWFFNLVVAAPITVLIAFLSWHLLEKRVLYLKNHPQMRRFMAYPVRYHSWSLLNLWRKNILALGSRAAR